MATILFVVPFIDTLMIIQIVFFLQYLNSTTKHIDQHQPANDFLNTMRSCCFQPQILQPTRIRDPSATFKHFTISGNIIYAISDHLPNFLIFDKFSSLSNTVKLYKRDYSHFNAQHLLSEFQMIDWHSAFLDQNASNIFRTFYNKIYVIIDKHIPVK